MEQNKMQNLLRLLMLLAGNKRHSVASIAGLFSMSERTVYRYFDTIEKTGFVLEKKEGLYRLEQEKDASRTLGNLLHFNQEEVLILFKTLGMIETASPVAERLINKLNILYGIKTLANQYKDVEKLERIKLLNEAITGKKQALLHDYRSSNSGNIYSRLVEPFKLDPDFQAVLCYDTESHTCKNFRVSRIQRVSLTNENWQNETEHHVPITDAFRMNGPEVVAEVEATLTLRAFNLLIEEFQQAAPYINPVEQGGYYLKIPVVQFEGVGRFMLGMAGEVQVVGPPLFKAFLVDKIKTAIETSF